MLGLVTNSRVAINRDGLKAGRIMQVVITDPRDVQSIQLVSQTGEESNPPAGSLVCVVPDSQGMKVGVATSDGILPDLAVGGKRIYSTDTPGLERMADVRLDPDGKITVTGPVAKETLLPDGTVTVENANSDIEMLPDGRITLTGPIATQTMMPDGTITLDNANGTATIAPNGQISLVNGAGSITISAAGVITFHGTASNFDHPITVPAMTVTTANGGTGQINCKKVVATEDVLSAGKSGATHQHLETGSITFGPS